MADGIIRDLTEDEKKEMREIGNIDVFKRFRKKKEEYESEMTRKHVHFCNRCASLDFKKLIEGKIAELAERREGYNEGRDGKAMVELDKFDLTRYSDKERFNLIRSYDCVEQDRSVRPPVPYITGTWYDYQCRHRGCMVTVLVPKTPVNATQEQIAQMREDQSKRASDKKGKQE